MGQKVILLKPFVFSSQPVKDSRIPREVHFKPQKDPKTGEWIPTEVELVDDVAGHPYIAEHFADGAIERPEVTKERLAVLAKSRKKQDEEDSRIVAQAQAAYARAQGQSETRAVSDEQLQKDLNTPVNELAKTQGEDIGDDGDDESGKKGKKGKK